MYHIRPFPDLPHEPQGFRYKWTARLALWFIRRLGAIDARIVKR